MEANKLLVDVVIFLLFFLLLAFYVNDYKMSKNKVRKQMNVVLFLLVSIIMWVYTYASIGLDLVEVVHFQ